MRGFILVLTFCAMLLNSLAIGLAIGYSAELTHAPMPEDIAKDYGAYLSGDVFSKQGDNAQAARSFERALKSSPNNIVIKQRLLLAYLLQGYISQAIQLNTQLPAAQLLPISQLLTAISSFNKDDLNAILTLAEDPAKPLLDNLALVGLKAWALYGLGRSEEATQLLSKLSSKGSDAAKLKLSSTITTQMPEKVRQLFRPFLFYHMALLREQNNLAEAAKYYRQALLSYSGSLEDLVFYRSLLINYVALLQKQGDYKTISLVLIDATNRYHNDSVLEQLKLKITSKSYVSDRVFNSVQVHDAHAGAAAMLLNISSFTHYLKLEGSDKLYADLAHFLNNRNTAVMFQYAGLRSAEALSIFTEVFRTIKPYSIYYVASKLQEALTCQQLGRLTTAIRILRGLNASSRVASSNAALATYLLTDIYANTGHIGKASQLIEIFIKRQKYKTWYMYYQAGIIFSKLDNLVKASKYFESALALAPDNAELLNYYGYVLLQNNTQLPKALSLLHKANDLAKNNGYILDSLGLAYYLTKDYDQSLLCLVKAVELCPFESEVVEHLGDLYWRMGKKRNAIYEWQHALDATKNLAAIEKLKTKLKQGLIARPIAE